MPKQMSHGAKTTLNLLRDFFLFPAWWYYSGLWILLSKIKSFLSNRQKSLAFWVWTKNLFVPMYGQENFSGRIISFFIRLVQIIARGVFMLFWALISLAIILIWIFLPIYAVYQIIFQLI